MKNLIFTLLFLTSFNIFSQIIMSAKYGSDDVYLNKVLRFENIEIEKLIFEGKELKGRHYEIYIKEYKDGNFVKKTTLFDSSEAESFRIKNHSLTVYFLVKITPSKLFIQLQGNRFSTPKRKFNLLEADMKYALKDFIGAKDFINIVLGRPNYILCIITPTVQKNGYKSHCKVAQSKVNPENFGKNFKIPHYFLVGILLK